MAAEPTTEFAPCPPFFVDNIYEIFLSTAANNNLTAEVTDEVWNICNLRYPYPSLTTTSTTTTTTTTPSTTSTTEKTTTTKQTTTSTTQPTTTTPSTTSTTEKTTTSTTQPTTTTPKQTTTTTTTSNQTTTSTTQQTTTTPKKTTTTTPEQTTISIISTSITKLTATTTTVASSTQETTEGPITLTVSKRCDTVCLSLVLAFVACILIGLLISLIYCKVHYRRRKHVMKLSHRTNWKTINGRYIPKFPKISKQADLTRNTLAFINPTFLTESVNIHDPYEQYRAVYQPITEIFPWNQSQDDPFPDYESINYQSHYEVCVNSEPLFNPNEGRKNIYSNWNGKSPSAEIKEKRVRHPSIGSHVPKMLPEYTEICPFGIERYDTRNSRLPKMNIDSTEGDGRMDTGPRQKKLPRIPLENNSVDSWNKRAATRLDTRDVHMNENIKTRGRDNGNVAHGLPRTPFDETESRDETTRLSHLPVSQINEHIISKSKDKESDTHHSKHGLPRTPFEQSEYLTPRQTKQLNDLAARERECVANGNIKSNPFSLYQGNRDGYMYNSSTQDKHLQENDYIDESSNRRAPYVRL